MRPARFFLGGGGQGGRRGAGLLRWGGGGGSNPELSGVDNKKLIFKNFNFFFFKWEID